MPGQPRYKNISQLNDSIVRLREKSKDQEKQMRYILRDIREDLKPANLLRNSISSLAGDRELRNSALQTIAGLLITFLANKYLGGKKTSKGASLIQSVMENEDLRNWGSSMISNIFRGNKKKDRAENSD